MRVSGSIKISCSIWLKGSLFSPRLSYIKNRSSSVLLASWMPYPRGWGRGKEFIPHINASNFPEACLVCPKKLNIHRKSFCLKEDLTFSQGCTAGKLFMETHVVIFRLCSVLLVAKISPCSLQPATSRMEKTQFFSLAASQYVSLMILVVLWSTVQRAKNRLCGESGELASMAKERCPVIP